PTKPPTRKCRRSSKAWGSRPVSTSPGWGESERSLRNYPNGGKRMVQRFAGLFAALALLSQEAMAQDATAQDRIDLEPASSWVMNYDDDSCALQRQFGPEGQQVFLEIRQFGPGDELQFTAASKDFESRRGPFSVQIEPIDAVPRQNGGLFNVALGEGYAGRLFRLSLAEGEAEYDELYSHFVDTTPVLHEEQRELLHEGRRLWEKLATQDVRS